MERVHYRRYINPQNRSRTVSRVSNSNAGADSGSGSDSGFKERLLTQAIICGVILAAIMALNLTDSPHAAEIRTGVAAVLGYQLRTEQLTTDIQAFLANLEQVSGDSSLGDFSDESLFGEPSSDSFADVIPLEELPDAVTEALPEEAVPFDVLYQELITESAAAMPAPPWINPLEGYITSLFGPRINPVTDAPEFHNGIDIAAEIGTPVLATRDATVIHTGNTALNGYYMRLRCDEGYDIVYAHLDRILKEVGARAEQGQQVAYSGNTGLSTGPHLHYGIFRNGEMLDPLLRVELPMSAAAAAVYAARNP